MPEIPGLIIVAAACLIGLGVLAHRYARERARRKRRAELLEMYAPPKPTLTQVKTSSSEKG